MSIKSSCGFLESLKVFLCTMQSIELKLHQGLHNLTPCYFPTSLISSSVHHTVRNVPGPGYKAILWAGLSLLSTFHLLNSFVSSRVCLQFHLLVSPSLFTLNDQLPLEHPVFSFREKMVKFYVLFMWLFIISHAEELQAPQGRNKHQASYL